MDLSQRTTSLSGAEDQSWLGSAHGTEATESITLDPALFDLVTDFPDGFIPSGVVVAKVAATGLYGPYDDGSTTDDLDVAKGHLFTTVEMTATSERVTAALFTHGQVVTANLPTGHGLDAAAKADLPHIQYV